MPSRHLSRALRAFFVGATIGLALVLFVGAALAEPATGSARAAGSLPRSGVAAHEETPSEGLTNRLREW
jgi:hypothetical protein